jgi:hypothetical protein
MRLLNELTSSVGLVLPAIFSAANPALDVSHKILKISRGSSVILLAAYFAYVWNSILNGY